MTSHFTQGRPRRMKRLLAAIGVNLLVLGAIPSAGVSEPGDWLAPPVLGAAPAGYLVEGRYADEPILRLVEHKPLTAQRDHADMMY